MTNKKLFLLSLISSLFLLLITEPSFSFLHQDYFRSLESGLLAPLFFTLVFYFISSAILLFFSNQIFKLWLRKIVSWFLPLSIFLIWVLGGGGNSYVSPSSTDYAIFSGIVLTAMTLVFALVEKYMYKR
jgi:hypothetical protein